MNHENNPKGFYPLRQAIAEYVFRARAIRCSADQVIIVAGAQQGINLIARVHINSGDPVALEDPGYNGARYVFQSYAAQVWPIPVDNAGLNTDTLEALDTVNFKLLYLTPSHQLPIGSTLSLARRLKVIHWAQQKGTVIIEDDYDGEFRYSSQPIPALAALDTGGQSVVYVRTFSKALFTSLRIGYLVVPESLVDVYTWAKKLDDSYSPLLEQAALTEFIQNGSFEKYIRRMHKVYGSKRRLLEKALKNHFGDLVTILGESAGIFLTVRFNTDLDDETILQKLAALGVGIRTTARDYLSSTYTKSEFLMGYGDIDEKKIEEAVARMARAILGKT
jgi:GntR family transcriptional regulator/MocR family aminotransferase